MPAVETRSESKPKNEPEKKFRLGAVTATVWKNQVPGKTEFYRTVSLQRCYKDKDNKWQNTGALRVNDIPKARQVLSEAFVHMISVRMEDKK